MSDEEIERAAAKLVAAGLLEGGFAEKAIGWFERAGDPSGYGLSVGAAIARGDVAMAARIASRTGDTALAAQVVDAYYGLGEYYKALEFDLETGAKREAAYAKAALAALGRRDWPMAESFAMAAGQRDLAARAGDGYLADERREEAESIYQRAGLGQAEIQRRFGEDWLARGEPVKAANAFIRGRDEAGMRKAAEALLAKREFRNARIVYQRLGDKDGLRRVADGALKAEDYLLAADIYIELGEPEAQAIARAAGAALERDRVYAAEILYTAAGDKVGLKAVGERYLAQSEWEKAQAALKKAGEAESAINTRIGDALLAAGKAELAGDYYAKAGNRAGMGRVADIFIDSFLARGDWGVYNEAMRLYEKAGESAASVNAKIADRASKAGKHELAADFRYRVGDREGVRASARALLDAGQPYVAGKYYSLIGDKEGLRAVAARLARDGDLVKAEDYYAQIADSAGLASLADAYVTKGDYFKALDTYGRAGVSSSAAYAKVASDAESKGFLDIALEYYKKAEDRGAIGRVADRLLAREEFAKAEDALLASGLSAQAAAAKVADKAFALSRMDKAGEYYRKADSKPGLASLGRWHLGRKELAAAASYFRLAGDGAGLAAVADAYVEGGEYGMALPLYEESGVSASILAAADKAFAAGDYAAAAALYERAPNSSGMSRSAAKLLEAGSFAAAAATYAVLGDAQGLRACAEAARLAGDGARAAEYGARADSLAEGLESIRLFPGSWAGAGVSFAVRDDGMRVQGFEFQLVAKSDIPSDSLPKGLLRFGAGGAISIDIQPDKSFSAGFTVGADPFWAGARVEIRGRFASDSLATGRATISLRFKEGGREKTASGELNWEARFLGK
jgi:hypothetical protein